MLILGWLARRLLMLLLVALGSTMLVFLLVHLAPGSPAQAVLGIHATPASVAAFNKEYGLDRPLPIQFSEFVGRVVHGDLGRSLFFSEPVSSVIVTRIVPTLWIVGLAFAGSIILGVPLAILAATKPNSIFDHMVRAIPLLGFAMPAVWSGIMLILIFAVKFKLFPVGGFGTGLWGQFRSAVLPATVLALILAPILIRSLRASLLEVLGSDFIASARSKGIREWRIVSRHALRNALPSSVTVMALNFSALVGATVIAETVFAVHGIGELLAVGVLHRDLPVVQGVALCMAFAVLVVYLLTDLVQALLDPRVRLQ